MCQHNIPFSTNFLFNITCAIQLRAIRIYWAKWSGPHQCALLQAFRYICAGWVCNCTGRSCIKSHLKFFSISWDHHLLISITISSIIVTRPKPAYSQQGLAGLWGQDTDQAGTFWGVLNISLCAFSPQLGWRLTWNHKKRPRIMKNHEDRPGTLNNHKNPPGTMNLEKP